MSQPEPTITAAQAAARQRERIRRLFSTNAEVRADAVEALKDAWAFDEPSFRVDELATHSSEVCSLMAARRDGQKELLTWLLKL